MSSYQSSAQLKASAKEHMFGHYKTAIGASMLVTLTTGFLKLMAPSMAADPTTSIGLILYYAVSFLVAVVSGLFVSGSSYFYLKIACGHHVTVSDIFEGFRSHHDKALILQAWFALCIFVFDFPRFFLYSRITPHSSAKALAALVLCTVLSAIVSIAVNLFYAPAFFLLHDFPQYSAKELLALSRKLMRGHKGRLFYICLGFLPLILLSLLSCGIAMLWVMPYMNTTMAEFYLDIVKNQDSPQEPDTINV